MSTVPGHYDPAFNTTPLLLWNLNPVTHHHHHRSPCSPAPPALQSQSPWWADQTKRTYESWKFNHSVVSNSWRPHGLQPTRLLRPWGFPGKSARVGCHCLLWYFYINGIKLYIMFYNLLFFSKTRGPLSLVSDIGLHHFQWLHTWKNTHTIVLHNLVLYYWHLLCTFK